MVDFGFNWISFSTSEFAWLCLHPQVSDHIARRRPITRWYRWNPADHPARTQYGGSRYDGV